MAIEMLNMDCMDYLKSLPDKVYDLVIVDPEYGINVAARGKIGSCSAFGSKKSFGKKNTLKRIVPATDYGKKSWDKNSVTKNVLNEIIRVSKNQIIFGANHFISKIPFDSSCWIVWDKDNSGNYADCELAWTSFTSAVKKIEFRWNGMLQGDMKNKQKRIHPTEKPIQLYKKILTNYAKPGDKILDTHGGSGSIAIACYDLGFDLTWIELDKDYFNAAKHRYEAHVAKYEPAHLIPGTAKGELKLF